MKRYVYLAATTVATGLVVAAMPEAATAAGVAAPTAVTVDGSTAGKQAADRAFVGTASPMLRAQVNWPGSHTDLRAVFQWQQRTGDAWADAGAAVQDYLISGSTGVVTVQPGLAHGGVYRFRARTENPWHKGVESGVEHSRWSAWGQFEVDTVGPDIAPIVSSPVYGTDPNQAYGEIGLAADFTFDSGGIPDVVGYRWGWSDTPMHSVATTGGAPVTMRLTPPPPFPANPLRGGELDLTVQSFDRTGRTGPLTHYRFSIGDASHPVGSWSLSEAAGATEAADTADVAHHGGIKGATPGVAGLLLDGPGGAAATAYGFDGGDSVEVAQSIVDTSAGFTVSAWAWSDDAMGTRAVAGQDGESASGLFLGQRNGKWAFGDAVSTFDVQPGTWAQLAGINDVAAGEQRLYVNGKLAGIAKVGATAKSEGRFTIGRAQTAGAPAQFWSGRIADVQVWRRPLFIEQELPALGIKLAGYWGLNGDTEDYGPQARNLTAAGALDWTDTFWGDMAARFDGGTTLRTDGPALREGQSYTVAGWARLDSAGEMTAISQGNLRVGIELAGETPHWTVSDGTVSARAADPAVVGNWVYVTVVNDTASGELRLYVEGKQVAAVATSTTLSAGPLVLGGQADLPSFVGGLNGIRAYQGVLADSKIAAYAQY